MLECNHQPPRSGLPLTPERKWNGPRREKSSPSRRFGRRLGLVE